MLVESLIITKLMIRLYICHLLPFFRAVGKMIFTLFWPLIPWILQLALFGYWGASALYLASMGQQQYASSFKNVTNTTNDDGTFTLEEVVYTATDYVPCDPNENSTAGSVCNFLKNGGDE